MTRLVLILAASLAFALGACKKDDCETARALYVEQAGVRADRAISELSDPADKAEAKKAADAELAAAGAKFVPVCQELGAAKVLSCVNEAVAGAGKKSEMTAECKALGDQLQAKLYGTP